MTKGTSCDQGPPFFDEMLSQAPICMILPNVVPEKIGMVQVLPVDCL